MKKKGITDYKSFALDVIKITKDKPISFEIFADELDEMYKQATEISKWGKNVNVKKFQLQILMVNLLKI